MIIYLGVLEVLIASRTELFQYMASCCFRYGQDDKHQLVPVVLCVLQSVRFVFV